MAAILDLAAQIILNFKDMVKNYFSMPRNIDYDLTLTAGGHFEKYEIAPLRKTKKKI